MPRVRGRCPMPDEGARGWLVKYSTNNHWRVNQCRDLDELIQDGYLWYAIVRDRYPQAVDKPHIMRLFQVTFINHVHDLSKHQSRLASIIDHSVDLHNPATEALHKPVDMGDGYFIPQSAPWYVHAFLRLLCSPEGPSQLRRPYRVRMSGVREMTHHRLCRLIGADPLCTPTLPDALENYFATV